MSHKEHDMRVPQARAEVPRAIGGQVMSKETENQPSMAEMLKGDADAMHAALNRPGASLTHSTIERIVERMYAAAARIADLESIVERLSADKIDDLETILLAGSCECREDDEERFGWWYHSCISDQEHALRELLELGIYELHPKYPAYFRRKPAAAEAARTQEQEKTR